MGKLQCTFCKVWVSEYSETQTCNCGISGSSFKRQYDAVQGLLDSRSNDEETLYWLCERCNKPNVYKSQSCKHCGGKR